MSRDGIVHYNIIDFLDGRADLYLTWFACLLIAHMMCPTYMNGFEPFTMSLKMTLLKLLSDCWPYKIQIRIGPLIESFTSPSDSCACRSHNVHDLMYGHGLMDESSPRLAYPNLNTHRTPRKFRRSLWGAEHRIYITRWSSIREILCQRFDIDALTERYMFWHHTMNNYQKL